MKKIITLTLVITLTLSIVFVFGGSTAFVKAGSEIKVTINGELQEFVQSPVIIDGSTMVPMRGIFEALGATIKWNGTKRSVIAIKGNTIIYLKIGEKKATINGRIVPLSVEAQIVNGSTMVPLRFVSEALGAEISWDSATHTVEITLDNNEAGIEDNTGSTNTNTNEDGTTSNTEDIMNNKRVTTGALEWQRIEQLYGSDLSDIIYANDLFIAVGSNGTIKISSDSKEWRYVDSGIYTNFNSITWDGETFWITGSKGTILKSNNGLDWEKCSTNTDLTINKISWNDTVYVAIGEGNLLLYSKDGSQWNKGTFTFKFSDPMIDNVYFKESFSRDLEEIVWFDNTFTIFMFEFVAKSSDGISWVIEDTGQEIFFTDVQTYNNELVTGTSSSISKSTDGGLTWESVSNKCGCNYFGIKNGLYYREDYATDLYVSEDMVNWTLVVQPQTKYNTFLKAVAYGQGKYVAVGDNELMIISEDGYQWDLIDLGVGDIYAIATNGEKYVAVGEDIILYSNDGIQWEKNTNSKYDLYSIEWDGSKFVAGGIHVILVSKDGVTWEKANLPVKILNDNKSDTKSTVFDLAWNGKILVAGCDFSMAYISEDGDTWEPIDFQDYDEIVDYSWNLIPPFNIHSVEWDGSRFVASFMFWGADIYYILTSEDGRDWNVIKMDKNLGGTLAYGNNKYLISGDEDVYSSDNLHSWEKVLDKKEKSLVSKIGYVGDYFIVGYRDGSIALSKDGENWKEYEIGMGGRINDVLYDGNNYYLVGNDGMVYTTKMN